MKLSECPSKSNNLQLLRFIAAILVIISHSFVLSTGKNTDEWLLVLTKGQLSLGDLAVAVFFCAGGYLIAKSICRVQNGFSFFKARILRIFPVLIVVILVSAFVIGPCITELSLTEYFKKIEVYRYLLNAMLILQHNLPGVFLNSPYSQTVNGSLWTLPVEFLCYIGCFIMWKLKFLKKENVKKSIPIVLLGIVGVVFLTEYVKVEFLISFIRPMLLFYMGILLYVLREEIIFNMRGALICLFLCILSVPLRVLNFALVLFFPYLLLYICFCIPQVSEKMAYWGNFSYGIYLCAFPIQQIIVTSRGGYMSPFCNMLLAIPIACIIGYVLYTFIEVPITSKDIV